MVSKLGLHTDLFPQPGYVNSICKASTTSICRPHTNYYREILDGDPGTFTELRFYFLSKMEYMSLSLSLF